MDDLIVYIIANVFFIWYTFISIKKKIVKIMLKSTNNPTFWIIFKKNALISFFFLTIVFIFSYASFSALSDSIFIEFSKFNEYSFVLLTLIIIIFISIIKHLLSFNEYIKESERMKELK